MNDEAVTTFAIVWIICAFLGAAIGSNKGRGGEGFILGLLLGVIGVIIAAVMSPSAEKEAEKFAMMSSMLGGQQNTGQAPSGWWPDPHGRHQHRYWDGFRWTDHVANNGIQSIDLPLPPPG